MRRLVYVLVLAGFFGGAACNDSKSGPGGNARTATQKEEEQGAAGKARKKAPE